MKVLLIDIDSKIPNLALHKIAKYHTDKGDTVEWNLPLYRPLADQVYVSCVFEKNKGKCYDYEDDPKCLIGGSGYSLDIELPEEIENINPKLNLGFTTRGCIRNCKFCIVPQKEGKIRPVGDLVDLWDGKSKDITLLDNNILALPDHFKAMCRQARDIDVRLDFNQGLDCRLMTEEIAWQLDHIKYQELHFAWDDLSYEKDVIKTIDLMGEKRCTWLVLVGFDTTLEEDLYRVSYLKSRNQNAYVMRYNGKTNKELTALSRWVNNRVWFQAITWDQFLERNYPNLSINNYK